jgi:hypothetical protein
VRARQPTCAMATEASALMREAPPKPADAALLAWLCPCLRRGSPSSSSSSFSSSSATTASAPHAAADAAGYNALARESSAIPEAVWKGLWSEGAAKQ